MQFRPGHVIRDYKIEARIGRGGFAEVYQANQMTIDRRVALKVILPQYANDQAFLTRFNAEARFVARIEHPHIVPLYEYWHDEEDGAFLVMRWIDGGTLTAHLKENGLTFERFVAIMRQIGAALSVAHDNNIVHRDIKPENVLFDRYGNAYLTDFGIAKDVESNSGLTAPETVMGTPSYLSPEQVRGDPVSAQSDIYNLGVLMYEAIAGEHPFEKASMAQMLRHHLNDPLPMLKVKDYDLNTALNNVIQQATAKAPELRYRTVNQLLRELDALLSRQTPEGRASQLIVPDSERENVDSSKAETRAVQPNSTLTTSVRLMGDLKASIYRQAATVFRRPRKLIGRDAQLERVNNTLKTGEPLLIHGPGGLGKTSLVATAVAQHLEAGGKPVIWLEAGHLDASRILEALAASLDVYRQVAALTADSRITFMREILAENSYPIVLDDIWNDQALFQVMKAIPFGLPIILTSRSAIPIDGDMLDIGLLSSEDALSLLGYHARRDLKDDESAKQLCSMVGNHTFAVELAGKHIKLGDDKAIDTLLSKIKTSPHALAAPGQFADFGRQSIQDLLQESYMMLDDDAKDLLTAMGGMKSHVTSASLLGQVLDQKTTDLAKKLESLEQRGLVRVEQHEKITAAYLHELTHSYARQLFRASRFWGTLPETVHKFVEAHKEDFDLLEFEQRNILGTLQRNAVNAQTRINTMKILVLEGYLNMRGHSADFLTVFDAAILDARYSTDKILLHQFYSKRGNVAADLDDWENAVYYYRQALDIAISERLEDRQVIVRCVLSNACIQAGDQKGGMDHLALAEALAQTLNDDFLTGYVLENQGYVAQLSGDIAKATEYFKRGVDVARRSKDDEALYFALLNFGTAQGLHKKHDEAIKCLTEALTLARKNGHSAAIAETLESLGMLYHEAKKADDARQHLQQALDKFIQCGLTPRAVAVQAFLQEHYSEQPGTHIPTT